MDLLFNRTSIRIMGVSMGSIFVSAGHGGDDPGATSNNRREADIAVDFRNMVALYIERAGIRFATDGKLKVNDPLRRAVVEAKKHTIAIEFHCNAASSAASGTETLSAPKDYALCTKLCKAVSGKLQIKNRGAKPENSGQHHRLAFVQAGGIIMELLFITNKSDLANYDKYKWLAAKEVADILIGAVR